MLDATCVPNTIRCLYSTFRYYEYIVSIPPRYDTNIRYSSEIDAMRRHEVPTQDAN